jgi:hypothetical protein
MAFGAYLVAWGVILFIGIQLYLGVVEQKVPGYPNPAQFYMYVLFPSILVITNAVLIACARRLPFSLLLAAFAVQLLALPMFIILGGGGV